MGTKYSFKCIKCGYTANISGGRDYGMISVVRTMICRECRKLVDVLVGFYGKEGKIGDKKMDAELGLCPICNGEKLKKWKKSMPCPKCDSRMEQGDIVCLWD